MRLDETADAFIAFAATRNRPSEVWSKKKIVRLYLIPFFGACEPDAIDETMVEDFAAAQVAKGFAPHSVNNQLTVLNRWLKRLKVRNRPPMPWLHVPEPDYDFLSFEERDRLLAHAESTWRPMITFAVTTGLRLGELFALR